MKKTILIVLALIMALSALTGCSGSSEKKLREITINEVTRSVFYAPLYVAVNKGFFEEEGMKVNIVTGGGSDKSMTALISGEADFALMGPETGVYVVNEGKQEHPMVIAQLTKRDGSFLVGREKDDNFDWESLRGKTIIGGRKGGMPLMTLEYVLKQHGLIPGKDVEVITSIQFNMMGGAFDSGTGDFVTLFEPTATEFQNQGKGYIVANVGQSSGEVPYTAFMTNQKTIKNDKSLVEAFVRAIYKAQQWVKNATDREIAENMQPFFPDTSIDSLEIVAKSYRQTDSWMTNPVMTEDSFNRLLDIIESAGELKGRVNISELVDNSFAEKAMNGK